jgi:protein-disulfide isomerase
LKTRIVEPLQLWETTFKWLRLTGNNPNLKYCKDEITTHPDYPALTSLTDFLDSGGLEYQAVKADSSFIDKFNYPLLAHIREPGIESLQIVENPKDWSINTALKRAWSGVVIYQGINGSWTNAENDVKQTQAALKRARLITVIFVFFFVYGYLSYKYFSFQNIIFSLLSICGLIISIWTIGSELGIQNNFVKQVCGTVSNGGCNKVLNSRYARGIAGVTMGDLATIYFATQLIAILINPLYPNIFTAVVLLCLPGIAVAICSIWIQAIEIKEWCALCLGIVAVIFFQFSFSSYLWITLVATYTLGAIFALASIGLVITSMFFPLKRLFKEHQAGVQKVTELKKWKNDGNLFLTQWKDQRIVDTSVWENDLIIGNPVAPLQITVACNPYCKPCAKAHKELDKMVEDFKNIVFVQVRFLVNFANENDAKTRAVKAILQKVKSSNNEKIAEMLSDWFELMNYEKWIRKWELADKVDVTIELAKHDAWSNRNAITFTPSIFVNGRSLPNRYGINDLQNLIPQLRTLLGER